MSWCWQRRERCSASPSDSLLASSKALKVSMVHLKKGEQRFSPRWNWCQPSWINVWQVPEVPKIKDTFKQFSIARENHNSLQLMQKEFEVLQSPSVKCREFPGFLKIWKGQFIIIYFFLYLFLVNAGIKGSWQPEFVISEPYSGSEVTQCHLWVKWWLLVTNLCMLLLTEMLLLVSTAAQTSSPKPWGLLVPSEGGSGSGGHL